MIYRPPIDENTKRLVRERVAEGHKTSHVAGMFGVSMTIVRMWTDPEYARKRKDAINRARRKTA